MGINQVQCAGLNSIRHFGKQERFVERNLKSAIVHQGIAFIIGKEKLWGGFVDFAVHLLKVNKRVDQRRRRGSKVEQRITHNISYPRLQYERSLTQLRKEISFVLRRVGLSP